MPQPTATRADVSERVSSNANDNGARSTLHEEYAKTLDNARNQLGDKTPEAALNGNKAMAKIAEMFKSQKEVEGFGFGTCTIMDSGAKVCRVEEGTRGSAHGGQRPSIGIENAPTNPIHKPGEKPSGKPIDPPCAKSPEGNHQVPTQKPDQNKPIKDPGFLRPLIPGKGPEMKFPYKATN